MLDNKEIRENANKASVRIYPAQHARMKWNDYLAPGSFFTSSVKTEGDEYRKSLTGKVPSPTYRALLKLSAPMRLS